jgi:hypothetical protein
MEKQPHHGDPGGPSPREANKMTVCSRKRQEKVLTTERRSGIDRRLKKHPNLRSLLWGGRREEIRRAEDCRRVFIVDRYRQSLFGAIVFILFLSVIDAILTMLLLQNGAVEINPIMAFYIDLGPYTFLMVKYGLTAFGVLLLLHFRNVMLKWVRLRAEVFIYVVLVAFLSVVSWQIYLMYRIII